MATLAALSFILAAAARSADTRPLPRLDPSKEFAVVAREKDYYVIDSVAGFIHKAYARRVYEWPEHPGGRIELKTNNLGFRNDSDTRSKKAAGATRILVVGDSHTDGVVNNAESFVSLLQRKLGPRFEALNGGVGHYGPQNYTGFLKRFMYLKPDVFIVAMYSANDFLDATRVLGVSPALPDYSRRLEKAHRGNAAWELDQIYYFKNHPADLERSVLFTQGQFDEMKSLCARRGIRLIVLVLPSKVDVEPAKCEPELEQGLEDLGLTEADLGMNRALTGRMKRWFARRGIRSLDLEGELKRFPSEKLYWKSDYHLDVRGHARVADAVYRAFARELDYHAPER